MVDTLPEAAIELRTIAAEGEAMFDRQRALARAKDVLLGMQSHARRERGWAYRHGYRTANLALWLRARLFPAAPEMDDVLYAAGLFHDCAKDDEQDHAAAGAIRAAEYLHGIVPEELLPAVTRAIHMHNKRGQPGTELEKLLQDADIIDHFGTIEVWLNVSYSVLGGEGPERSLQFYDTEWQPMIAELNDLLNHDLSKAVFRDRIAYNDEFIRRLRIEAEGGVAAPEDLLPPPAGGAL